MSDAQQNGNDFFVEKDKENGTPGHQAEVEARRKKVAARDAAAGVTPKAGASPEPVAKEMPAGEYLSVKLSSLGKLSVPKELHVRNYHVQDALDLSVATTDEFLNVLVGLLDGMIWEDINVGDMHEKELEELMLTLFANFWSKTVTVGYPYDENELKHLQETSPERAKKVEAGDEFIQVDIPIPSIETTEIIEEFKEPITIEIDGKKAQFVLPRISHVLNARAWVGDKYAREEKEFAAVRSALEENERIKAAKLPVEMPLRPIDPDAMAQYQEYVKNRNRDFVKGTECQVLVSYDGKDLHTFEERLEAFTSVDLRFWKAYNKIAEKYGAFGVQEEVEVTSPITQEKVTRRFSFLYMDFVPAMELQDDSGFTVSFGD